MPLWKKGLDMRQGVFVGISAAERGVDLTAPENEAAAIILNSAVQSNHG